MINDWQNFLVDHASERGSPEVESSNFCFIITIIRTAAINGLWFQGSEFRVLVTKLDREPEFENRKRAHGSAPAWVPQHPHFGQWGSFWRVWMQGLPGTRYAAQMKHSSATLRSMIEMVASLHGEVAKSPTALVPDRYERLVSSPLRTVVEFGKSVTFKERCAKVAAAVPAEWIAAMPVIPQHGDLFCDLLLHNGQWHVIDWESFGTIDLPFYDLLTLLLSLAGATDKGPEAWDAPLVRQIPELVQRYACALSLQAAAVRRALPLTLVNWFYLQWCDGRQEFLRRIYKTLERYFSSPDTWERAFLGK
jgi:hypothetical protein